MSENRLMELVSTGMFAPFTDQPVLQTKPKDGLRATFYAILGSVLGWIAMGWLIVQRYNLTRYFQGNMNAPAKVYAYENNFIFMLETIGLLVVLLWIFPCNFQMILNKMVHHETKATEVFMTQSFTATSFSVFFLPVILALSWTNQLGWQLLLTNEWKQVVFAYFFACITYSYLCAAYRSRQQFGISWKLSWLHLWVPILLILAEIIFDIF